MADNQLDAIITQLLQQESSPEMQELRRMILRRLATETEIKPARVPAPLNITEIGGYYNLLKKNEKMQARMLASILGLPYASEE